MRDRTDRQARRDVPVALACKLADATVEAEPTGGEWVEIALTALFTATAVLFVSFLAAVTGLA